MIILQKNGNIFIGEEPLPQGVLDGALAILANPQAGDTITFDGERWAAYDGTDKVWKNVAPTAGE